MAKLRFKRIFIATLLCMVLLPLGWFGWLGWRASNAIIYPAQNPQAIDFHRIAQKPDNFGLHISEFKSDNPALQGVPCFEISSATNLALPLRQSQIADDFAAARKQDEFKAKAVVLLHDIGYDYTQTLPLAERFTAMGLRCFALDLAGHGHNLQRAFSYGKYEKQQVAVLIKELLLQYPELNELAIVGIGIGGGIAFEVAADEPSVRNVVSINAFATLNDWIWREIGHQTNKPMQYANYLAADLFTRMRCDYRLFDVAPVADAARCKIPALLLVLGKQNYQERYSENQRILEALSNKNKQLIGDQQLELNSFLLQQNSELYQRIGNWLLDQTNSPLPTLELHSGSNQTTR